MGKCFFCVTLLQEFRAFELLRSGADRARYLLIKEAKIIAMTCTHAALKRHDLVAARFQVCVYVSQTNDTYTLIGRFRKLLILLISFDL